MSRELAKTYNPGEVEDRIYDFWMQGGYFHANRDETKKPYTIVMPPPNITGQLHMGHALDETLQDILIRWRRMQGYDTLWVPGTDHASIATEAKIVEAMRQEGITKEQIGREAFLERAWAWKEKYGGRIKEQLKKLGVSCDWERERFTLDEGCSKAVREVFVSLYEKGLIYRGERIVNWCPHCKTTISDAEVEFEEKDGYFWHLRYPFEDGSGYLELATTRPETMLGDTAVAVHPDDERYKAFVGKTLILPLVGRRIPVVADSYVDMEFGTGVVKITPAHDPNDFEVGLRHNLEVINVMNDDGSINENGGKYAGLPGLEARRQIVEDLKEQGFLVSIEPIRHNVGTCYRCHSTIEPRVSKQWFVKMEPLAKPAIEVVRSGENQVYPRTSGEGLLQLDGEYQRLVHQPPALVGPSHSGVVLCGLRGNRRRTRNAGYLPALRRPSSASGPGYARHVVQFCAVAVFHVGLAGQNAGSCALLSDLHTRYRLRHFVLLGCPHDLFRYRADGETPFSTVFFHGLVRDSQGRKMSKSLGNGIDPLEVIQQYGADALRFTLITGISPGNDTRFSDERVQASRNFANKIWNAARFIRMNIDGKAVPDQLPDTLLPEDEWILDTFNTLCREVNENLEKFEIGIAAQKIHDFLWDQFCDWYIEIAKIRLNGEEEAAAQQVRQVLVWVMNRTLALLHPFMPYITEEIWQALPHEGESADDFRLSGLRPGTFFPGICGPLWQCDGRCARCPQSPFGDECRAEPPGHAAHRDGETGIVLRQ